jgi:hypothetical protein
MTSRPWQMVTWNQLPEPVTRSNLEGGLRYTWCLQSGADINQAVTRPIGKGRPGGEGTAALSVPSQGDMPTGRTWGGGGSLGLGQGSSKLSPWGEAELASHTHHSQVAPGAAQGCWLPTGLVGAGDQICSAKCFMSHLTTPRPGPPSTADIMAVFTHKSGKLFY